MYTLFNNTKNKIHEYFIDNNRNSLKETSFAILNERAYSISDFFYSPEVKFEGNNAIGLLSDRWAYFSARANRHHSGAIK